MPPVTNFTISFVLITYISLNFRVCIKVKVETTKLLQKSEMRKDIVIEFRATASKFEVV